ncbi:Hypothetical protein, putative [Bodo saltans]|uniref:Uncharacterized protein n=1 Tax=Bodo saltans TaxID=75058 RepID=A0A0S4JPL4_BODSA|nr:Hypothetical protein, putative [Bodo saltans]|eukprot:CUG92176.1 Hypothetical protein, putative [Bodo saltans]
MTKKKAKRSRNAAKRSRNGYELDDFCVDTDQSSEEEGPAVDDMVWLNYGTSSSSSDSSDEQPADTDDELIAERAIRMQPMVASTPLRQKIPRRDTGARSPSVHTVVMQELTPARASPIQQRSDSYAALEAERFRAVQSRNAAQLQVAVLEAEVARLKSAAVLLVSKVARTQQLLTAKDKEKRVKFCEEMLKNPNIIDRLVFSDEKYFFVSFGNSGRSWCLPAQAPHQRLTVQHPSKRMVWLGIGDFGPNRANTNTFWYQENSMQDAQLYIETLVKA